MVLGYVFSYSYIVGILLLAVLAEKFKLLSQEGRRKLIHILLVFTWLIMIHYFKGTIHMIIIPFSFVLLNLLSYLGAKSENGFSVPVLSAMERHGQEETPGTVYYALSIMVMGGLTIIKEELLIPCGMGLFCMAFGDGMAGVIGKKTTGFLAKKIRKEKSIGGCMACFVFSVVGCALLLFCMQQDLEIGKLLALGLCCMILEIPGYGIDNLTVPFGCMMAAMFLFG